MTYAGTLASSIVAKRSRTRARECNRCGGSNYSAGYNTCETCRDLTAAYGRLWREDHRVRGLCTRCVEKRRRGEYTNGAPTAGYGFKFMKCQAHLDYFKEAHSVAYKAKRRKGLCGYGACQTKSKKYMCELHLGTRKAAAERKADGFVFVHKTLAATAKPLRKAA